MIDNFLLNLAAELTQTLMQAGDSRLRQITLGTAEEQSLCAAFTKGFESLLTEAAAHLPQDDLGEEHQELLRKIFTEFLAQPDVADNLLALAVAGTPPDLPCLARRFDALDSFR
jgi:hypothetical protein